MAYSGETPKSKGYVLDNLKHLHSLVEKKKSAKVVLPLGVLFDEYADNTEELLKTLDEENANEKPDIKKEDIVKQIAHSMAVLQKLLSIMNSNQPEPLETYCRSEPGDALWGSLCGNRPAAKNVLQKENKKKKEEQSSGSIKIRYVDENDEKLTLGMGNH